MPNSARIKLFQSTLPHGERQPVRLYNLESESFNPRSRMGSDVIVQGIPVFGDVSIHAPAWGATIGLKPLILRVLFQSTLPHGERQSTFHNIAHRERFNPRSRMGSDSDLEKELQADVVSIHAPAWGAT